MRRIILLTIGAFLFATALVGCELVADFDRGKLPMQKHDAGIKPIRDGGSVEPDDDGGKDAAPKR